MPETERLRDGEMETQKARGKEGDRQKETKKGRDKKIQRETETHRQRGGIEKGRGRACICLEKGVVDNGVHAETRGNCHSDHFLPFTTCVLGIKFGSSGYAPSTFNS